MSRWAILIALLMVVMMIQSVNAMDIGYEEYNDTVTKFWNQGAWEKTTYIRDDGVQIANRLDRFGWGSYSLCLMNRKLGNNQTQSTCVDDLSVMGHEAYSDFLSYWSFNGSVNSIVHSYSQQLYSNYVNQTIRYDGSFNLPGGDKTFHLGWCLEDVNISGGNELIFLDNDGRTLKLYTNTTDDIKFFNVTSEGVTVTNPYQNLSIEWYFTEELNHAFTWDGERMCTYTEVDEDTRQVSYEWIDASPQTFTRKLTPYNCTGRITAYDPPISTISPYGNTEPKIGGSYGSEAADREDQGFACFNLTDGASSLPDNIQRITQVRFYNPQMACTYTGGVDWYWRYKVCGDGCIKDGGGLAANDLGNGYLTGVNEDWDALPYSKWTILSSAGDRNIRALNEVNVSLNTGNVYSVTIMDLASAIAPAGWQCSFTKPAELEISYIVNPSIPPSVKMIKPLNKTSLNWSDDLNLSCAGQDDYNLQNISFITNYTSGWMRYHTGTAYPFANYTLNHTTLAPLKAGNYSWTCEACDNAGQCTINGSNWSFSVLPSPLPTVELHNPLDEEEYDSGSPINFNCTGRAYPLPLRLANISLWHNVSGAWQLNETYIRTGFINATVNKTIYDIPDGVYAYNCQAWDNAFNYAWATNYTFSLSTTPPPQAKRFIQSLFGSLFISGWWL